MFELIAPTTVRLMNLTCRTEAAGKRKDVPAVTLRLKLEGVENTMLDLISPTARSTFYAPIEGQEQLPGIEPSTPILRSKDIKHWTPEEIAFHGWSVLIDRGIDGTSAIPMGKSKIDRFAVDLYEGGHIDMAFNVSTSDIDSDGVGILWASQKQQFPVTIAAPEVPAPAIDGSTEAFKADHPDATDLFAATGAGPDDDDDDEGSKPDATGEQPAEPQRGENWPFPTGGAKTDGEVRAEEAGAAEQRELEAGMGQAIAKAGVKPKGGRGKANGAGVRA